MNKLYRQLFIRLITLLLLTSSFTANADLNASAELTPIDTKQFLMVSGLIDPNTPMEKMYPYFKAEAQLAWKYYATHRMQQAFARMDELGVVILWEAKNIQEAKRAIEQMPMVKNKLIGYQLYPVKFFNTLSTLFSTDTPTVREVDTVAKTSSFILITQPVTGVTAEQVAPYLKEQALAIWHNYQTGLFRQLFDRGNLSQKGGEVIMMMANDVADAKQIAEQLPLVKNKLVNYQLIPVRYFFPFGDLFRSSKY
ncbi:MAG: hypothetical protein RL637_304 [Pseudomonadota bacterium]|jgi:hypothetical protein